MPPNVRPGQVMGLVEITGGLGSRIDTAKLADEMGADIAVLLPILDAAELLGLVKSEKGNVYLTDDGIAFQETSKGKVRTLADKLVKTEPFRTAMDLANRQGSVTSAEVADSLARKGIVLHYKPEMNESLVREGLIHWMTPAGLLRYNGKTDRFQKP